ncbi:MAG: hypothetical protein NVS4B1_30960 [Ktedonobacteraceae bacterium]
MQTLETFTTLQRGQVVPTNWLADLTSFVGHEQDITKALQLKAGPGMEWTYTYAFQRNFDSNNLTQQQMTVTPCS